MPHADGGFACDPGQRLESGSPRSMQGRHLSISGGGKLDNRRPLT
jgi:hypothetical protein